MSTFKATRRATRSSAARKKTAFEAGGEATSYAGDHETPEDMQGMPTEVDVCCLAILAPKEASGKERTGQLQHPVTPGLTSGGEQPNSPEAEEAPPDLPEENMDGLAQTLVQALKDNPTVIRALLSSLSKEALAAAMASRDPAPHASPSPSSAQAPPQERPAQSQPQQSHASPRRTAGGAPASAAGRNSGIGQGFVQEASQYPYAGHVEQLKAATQPMQSNSGQQGGPVLHLPGQPRWQPAAAIQSRGAARPGSAGAATTGASPQPAQSAEPARPGSANPSASMPLGLDLAHTPQRVHRLPVHQEPGPWPQPRSAGRLVPPPAAMPHRPISHRAFQEEERKFEEREYQERVMEERMATSRHMPPLERRTPPAHADHAPAAHADCTLAGVPPADAGAAEAGSGRSHAEGEEDGEPFAARGTANDAKPCKCKKSRCLKLYCDCFATGLFCNDACLCQDCENRTDTLSAVFKARQFIMVKDPAAFKPKVTDASSGKTAHVKGCACRKSRCLKKYCECFLIGVRCTENCRCVACLNNGAGSEGIVGAAFVQGSTGHTAAQPQQVPHSSAEQHLEGAAGPSAPRLPPRDCAPAQGGPSSREFTVPARTATAYLPVTDDPMGGWGIPGQAYGYDAMARPAEQNGNRGSRVAMRGLPVWNSVGQQLCTGRPTVAGTLLQRSMSALMTEVKGREAGQTGQAPSSIRAPQAALEQELDDVPAAGAWREEELMEDEERMRHFQEGDHREFDEKARMMNLDMARRSERASDQAGADLAHQSAPDNQSPPMDNSPSTAAGDIGQETKSEDEHALFAHPSQLALQETIADMELADRLAHAPDRNSPQDANLTPPKRHLSPRNRHLGPYDTDHGPRARDSQKQDLDTDTRHLTTHDRGFNPSGRAGMQKESRIWGIHCQQWVTGNEERGQRSALLRQHAEEPERDVGLRHRDISPHKRLRGEYLGPRDRDLSPHNRMNPRGYPSRQASDLRQHDSSGGNVQQPDRDMSARNCDEDLGQPGYPGRRDSNHSSGRGGIQQLVRDVSVPYSRNHGENLGQPGRHDSDHCSGRGMQQLERGISPPHKKGRGGRDEDWNPRDATPDRARPRRRRAGKRERGVADLNPSYSGRSTDGLSRDTAGPRTRRASGQQEAQEKDCLGLRWGVRKKVTISRVPEAWRDQQAAEQLPAGGNFEEAELAQQPLPSRQSVLNEMQQLGRNVLHKQAAFPAPKPEEGAPQAGGAAPGPHPPAERLADTESDAAEALLSFL